MGTAVSRRNLDPGLCCQQQVYHVREMLHITERQCHRVLVLPPCFRVERHERPCVGLCEGLHQLRHPKPLFLREAVDYAGRREEVNLDQLVHGDALHAISREWCVVGWGYREGEARLNGGGKEWAVGGCSQRLL